VHARVRIVDGASSPRDGGAARRAQGGVHWLALVCSLNQYVRPLAGSVPVCQPGGRPLDGAGAVMATATSAVAVAPPAMAGLSHCDVDVFSLM